jgi:DNA-binding NtrC family response regulator
MMASAAARAVMVVDDDKDIVRIIRIGLENAGFHVHAFTDPLVALEHIEQGCGECEVLISDIRMPRMNGFQLVKRIRQTRPEMKLLLMTAFEIKKTDLESVVPSTHIDNVIMKPFAISKLVSVLSKITNSGAIAP